MRWFWAVLSIIITVGFVYLLDNRIAGLPSFGKLLDPVNGIWHNAEPEDRDFSINNTVLDLNSDAEVWFDERLVPHIRADNDHDLYYLQGYVHAYFRLWQMDMQTRAAGGRVSEVIGSKALSFDREQRRKGMVYGAEQSLKAMEAAPQTIVALDAYTQGVNAFVNSISKRDYPMEYKLMGFAPEPWTNLKTALLLMYMADDLTGSVDDIEFSKLKKYFSNEEIDFYFPDKNHNSYPVIPVGTIHSPPSLIVPDIPIYNDVQAKSNGSKRKEDSDGKGSNNWVVAGSKTKSGAPILCDDPHLGLNLPSLWYEVQLTAPGINVYGASLPGAPGVVIGYNERIAWGFTNNYRDVKDFYEIGEIDNSKYQYNGIKKEFNKRIEVIRVKDSTDYIDTVKYTIHGPLMYDRSYHLGSNSNISLAIRWMAHLPSNELLSLYLLNRAQNYDEFVNAISYFICPAQNFVYADNSGNIAMWGQGQFVNKWKGQGKYIMKGVDSSTMWGDFIPIEENPHSLNPEQAYLASANQTVTDDDYPYWYNGTFKELRATRINNVLDSIDDITVEDMFRLQNDEYDVQAKDVTRILLSNIDESYKRTEYINWIKDWDYNYSAESKAATVYNIWWYYFYNELWHSTKFAKLENNFYPLHERTVQLLKDNDSVFTDVGVAVNESYQKAKDSLKKIETTIGLEWYKVRNTTIRHLTRLPAFSSKNALKTDGWSTTVNAMKNNHGPSWRMVVEMKDKPEGYAVYPGGQSGNTSGKYYQNHLKHWQEGKYYKLLFITDNDKPEEIKHVWKFKKDAS